jgi:hypothetical protein
MSRILKRVPARLRSLPSQGEISNVAAANVVAERLRHGELPVIAPKFILRTPMWVHHRTAALTGTYTRKWHEVLPQGHQVTQVVQVINNLPSTPSPSAHGVLRYLDLDVIMALSLSWTRTQNPAVEIEQRQLFKWMGYDDLTCAPYDELKCSLKRLENSQIAVFQEGSDPRSITPFRLIDSVVIREGAREKGKPIIIHTTLNRVWEQALATSDWQAIDLIGYAKLVREHRMVGLARVIYLYLASWRQPDGSFEVPVWSLRERFAQVRPNGNLKYNDPFNPTGMLMRALQVLHKSGVVSFRDLDPSDIPSQMVLTGTVNRISDPESGYRQQWLITPGMWDGSPRILEMSGTLEQKGEHVPEVPPEPPKPEPKKDRLAKDLKALKRRIQVSRKILMKAQSEGGWTDKHLRNLFLMVMWMANEGKIRDPAAFAASELANKEPLAYEPEAMQQTYDLKAIAEWVRSENGPLYEKPSGTNKEA